MHFDVLVPSEDGLNEAKGFAQSWLASIGMPIESVQLSRCQYCHSEVAIPEVVRHIKQNGYAVLPLEGCPASVA